MSADDGIGGEASANESVLSAVVEEDSRSFASASLLDAEKGPQLGHAAAAEAVAEAAVARGGDRDASHREGEA